MLKISKVTLIYFSPTKTTQKILRALGKSLNPQEIAEYDLTCQGGQVPELTGSLDELVILGSPVYGGRLPQLAIQRFQALQGNKTPVILVVVYGNREFEDALVELKNLALDLRFLPLACGAFIGEHSFSTKDLPIAPGRPDVADLEKALKFGGAIREKLSCHLSTNSDPLWEIPGRFPYQSQLRPLSESPKTWENICTLCGECVALCPTGAIFVNGHVTTIVEDCIHCCACIKSCKAGARVNQDNSIRAIATRLHEHASVRKEPQFFGVTMA